MTILDTRRLEELLFEAYSLVHDYNLEPVEATSIVETPLPPPVRPVDPPPGDDASFAFSHYGLFFDFLRDNKMLGPKITGTEFRGTDAIIKACALAKWPMSYTAYALGTAYHETAHTMLPIQEKGGASYYTRKYDIQGANPKKARELGNLTPGDGARFCGRGYVQLTGKANYAKATKKLKALGINVDLIANPERAMEPPIAALIMVYGMIEGWFTSRKLPDDLPAKGPATLRQFVLSRDIINGTDMDDEIAAYANDFQTGLQQGGYRIAA